MHTRSLLRFAWTGLLRLLIFQYSLALLTAQTLIPADLFADDSAIVGKKSILSRKEQEELAKAVEALRANAPAKAR